MYKKVTISFIFVICIVLTSIIGVKAISTSGKIKVGEGTTNTSYGKVIAQDNAADYSTIYNLSGGLVSGQVWIYDGYGKSETKSGYRSSNEGSSITSFRAQISKSTVYHDHYYQWWKE